MKDFFRAAQSCIACFNKHLSYEERHAKLLEAKACIDAAAPHRLLSQDYVEQGMSRPELMPEEIDALSAADPLGPRCPATARHD